MLLPCPKCDHLFAGSKETCPRCGGATEGARPGPPEETWANALTLPLILAGLLGLVLWWRG